MIYLNSNLEEHAIFAAALHEAMHNARVYDPEGFRHVQAFVVNYLTAEGKDTDALLGDIAARWGKDAATREVQMEELVCKTVEALAADSEALQRAIENKKNSGILKKVGDALRRIADRIMQYFKGDREQGQRGHNKQAQAFLDDAAALRQMAEMCSEAFENARENEREFGGKESEERYSKSSRDNAITSDNAQKNSSNIDPNGRYSKDDTIRFCLSEGSTLILSLRSRPIIALVNPGYRRTALTKAAIIMRTINRRREYRL